MSKAVNVVSGEKADKKDIDAALSADEAYPQTLPGTTTLIFRATQDDFDALAPEALEYTGRVFEQLADLYAARYGASKAGAEAISEFFSNHKQARNSLFGTHARASGLIAMVSSLMSSKMFWTLLAPFSTSAAAVLAGAGIVAFFLNLGTAVISAYSGKNEYDGPRTRLDKLLQQLSEQAKNPLISKEMAKKLVLEYKEIKAISEHFTDKLPWDEAVVTFMVSPWRRRNRFSAAMAEIEKLASNELYIKSQKFRTA